MSAALIKPYFRARLKVLGYAEHLDPDWKAVPENKLNKAFHLSLGPVSNRKNDQHTTDVSCPVVIRAYFKGSQNESASDKALKALDLILPEVLGANNRLSVSGIKNIFFDSAEVEPFSESNDDDNVLRMSFTAFVTYNVT